MQKEIWIKYNGGGYIKRKIIGLLLPFVMFSIINAEVLSFIQSDFSLWKIFIHGWGTNPLWFIPVLFVIEVIFYILRKGKSKIIKFSTICSVIVIFAIKIMTNKYGPWSFTEIPWFLLCYYSGFLIFKYAQCFDEKKVMHKRLLCFMISVTLFFLHWIVLYKSIVPYNINYRQQDNDFLSYIMRFCIANIGVVAVYFLSKSIVRTTVSRIIQYCGVNSIVILCMHMLFFQLFAYWNIPSAIIRYTSWIAIIPIIWIYNQYFIPEQIKLKKKYL